MVHNITYSIIVKQHRNVIQGWRSVPGVRRVLGALKKWPKHSKGIKYFFKGSFISLKICPLPVGPPCSPCPFMRSGGCGPPVLWNYRCTIIVILTYLHHCGHPQCVLADVSLASLAASTAWLGVLGPVWQLLSHGRSEMKDGWYGNYGTVTIMEDQSS